MRLAHLTGEVIVSIIQPENDEGIEVKCSSCGDVWFVTLSEENTIWSVTNESCPSCEPEKYNRF